MAYENKPGEGALFKNDKDGNEKRPDFRGPLVVPEGAKPGDELRVAGWKRKSKSGTPYISLAAELEESDRRAQSDVPADDDFGFGDDDDDDDDDIPF